MNHLTEVPRWWLNLAKLLLIFTACVVLICFFTLWAKDVADLGYLLVFGIYFMFSFATLLALVVVAAVGIVTGFFLGYPFKKYLIILVLSLASIIYFNSII